MTRAGGTMTRPDWVRSSPLGSGVTARAEVGWERGGGRGVEAGATVGRLGTGCEGVFSGKRGVVFALGGEPVNGGAEGRGG